MGGKKNKSSSTSSSNAAVEAKAAASPKKESNTSDAKASPTTAHTAPSPVKPSAPSPAAAASRTGSTVGAHSGRTTPQMRRSGGSRPGELWPPAQSPRGGAAVRQSGAHSRPISLGRASIASAVGSEVFGSVVVPAGAAASLLASYAIIANDERLNAEVARWLTQGLSLLTNGATEGEKGASSFSIGALPTVEPALSARLLGFLCAILALRCAVRLAFSLPRLLREMPAATPRLPPTAVSPAASDGSGAAPSPAADMPRIRKAKDPRIAALRATEYSRLDRDGHCYLDYTGGMLYPSSLITQHSEQLLKGTFGNPHSSNPTSHASTRLCDTARADVLAFFNADPDEYLCIFTANASGALRIVGESFPFAEGSEYLLLMDNHNSVNGIREFATARGARVTYARTNASLRIDDDVLERLLARPPPSRGDDEGEDADGNQNHDENDDVPAPRLFAYPAQSNFSGVKHSLEWVERAQQLGWYTLLDAAAFVPSSPLDLSVVHPDFVSMSFYKIFGYPTGIGALLMRKRCVPMMQRPWFAGGTIKFVTCAADNTDDSGNGGSGSVGAPHRMSFSPDASTSTIVPSHQQKKKRSPTAADDSDDAFGYVKPALSPNTAHRGSFPRDPMHVLAVDHEAFEDGTINYLSLVAISNGLAFMRSLGMERVCGHVQAITSDLIDALSGMVHGNGTPVVHILGPSSSYKRGGTVAINVVDVKGAIIPPMVVERLANEQMISIRSGCFCNPGDSEILFPEAWRAMMEILDEGDPLKAREIGLGIAAAVRISVGIPTSDADVVRLIKFLLGFKNAHKEQFDHLFVCPMAAH